MNSFYTITNFRRYREKESYTFDGKVTFAKRDYLYLWQPVNAK